jgi:hypothetical protein
MKSTRENAYNARGDDSFRDDFGADCTVAHSHSARRTKPRSNIPKILPPPHINTSLTGNTRHSARTETNIPLVAMSVQGQPLRLGLSTALQVLPLELQWVRLRGRQQEAQ